MPKAKPQRMHLSRHKGFSLQAESQALNGLPARRVTRPGPWGNPFIIADAEKTGLDHDAAQARAVGMCKDWLLGKLDPKLSPHPPPTRAEIREHLRGYNLACWCRPGTPCHADLLIDLAND